ncbi:leucyl aminopeptidase family protein [Flavobacterium pallidum]|uniref:Leucyl aminopeptidase n=1 Tax=Flavobacterium pallidum TaxID=2172098 RepID=A0A2S1SJC2_9FLAO|nr:leucyl aminopeptidase family protein [Flavobacterium pallidum]AWI26513.1 leucyl aminopeptidase [Flavobacterium pallidum]
MKITTVPELARFEGTIMIPVFETNAKSLVPIEFHGVSVSSKVFYGKKDSVYQVDKYDSLHLFIGLGKTPDYKSVFTIFRRIALRNKESFNTKTALVLPDDFPNDMAEAAFSGLLAGTYDIGHFKKTEAHPFLKEGFELVLLSKNENDDTAERAFKIAKAKLETYHLVDLPPNVITPEYLADWAIKTGNEVGFKTTVFDKDACSKLGMDAFLAVAQGSAREPQFIIMEYTPANPGKNTKHVGLVGKGITFDTGGLNIKTAGMLHMKSDMAGGAAVLGALRLIADLKLDAKVTAIVPACENAVDSTSFVPADVIKSYSGHSIEIIDTDAEGRLILADGLSYLIKNYKPEYVVDIATLTGSSVATLGYECGALFTNNDDISKQLQHCGDAIGERLWQLPLWDAYKQDIESEIADVKNFSGKPVAGAISAAKFLEFFTDNHKAWAHLDVAGVAFGDDEFAKTKHGTAFGVHLLTKFIENL